MIYSLPYTTKRSLTSNSLPTIEVVKARASILSLEPEIRIWIYELALLPRAKDHWGKPYIHRIKVDEGLRMLRNRQSHGNETTITKTKQEPPPDEWANFSPSNSAHILPGVPSVCPTFAHFVAPTRLKVISSQSAHMNFSSTLYLYPCVRRAMIWI